MIKINLGKSESIIVGDFYRRVVSHQNNPINLILEEISKNEINNDLLIDLIKSIEGALINNTQNIIVASPSDLRKYIEYFDSNYESVFKDKIIKDKILNCFYYSKYSKWGAYELANNLSVVTDIKVCPYCNRNYISVYGNDKSKGKTRMKFDHYYDKASYPYLALSFYNLIPSCSVCNSDLKSTKNFYLKEHIHPYEDDIDKLKFKLDIKKVEFINGDLKTYNIKLNTDKFVHDDLNKNKIKNHIDTFKIEKLYNFHRDITNDIIKKFHIYTDEKINELYNSFDAKLFSSKEEVFSMIYGSLVSENIKPFSKLTQDIIEDLNGKQYFFDE